MCVCVCGCVCMVGGEEWKSLSLNKLELLTVSEGVIQSRMFK